MGYVNVLGQKECMGVTAAQPGRQERRGRTVRQGSFASTPRKVGIHHKISSQAVTQLDFYFQKIAPTVEWAPNWRKAGEEWVDQLETIAKVLMSRDGSPE